MFFLFRSALLLKKLQFIPARAFSESRSGIFRNQLSDKLKLSDTDTNSLIQEIIKSFSAMKVDVTAEELTEALANMHKKGMTNAYASLKKNDVNYLIRINGQLWPPYNRENEQLALDIAKKNNIDTAVLFNSLKFNFQISHLPEKNFLDILKENNSEEIKNLISEVAQKISDFHRESSTSVMNYPIENILEKAKKIALERFDREEDKGTYQLLKKYAETCEKIIFVLTNLHKTRKFSHGELFANSIFKLNDFNKVAIVDWEYAGLAYWSHDLAVLCRYLKPEQIQLLADEFYSAQSQVKGKMDAGCFFELTLNTFLNEYIDLCWILDPKNISRFDEKLSGMEERYELFKNRLDNKYLTLSNPSKRIFLPVLFQPKELQPTELKLQEEQHSGRPHFSL